MFRFVFILALLLGTTIALAQDVSLTGAGGFAAAGGATAPDLDGSNSGHNFVSNSAFSLPITTTQSNDIIAVCIAYGESGGNGSAPNSVSSTNTTSWAKRKTVNSLDHSTTHIDLWYGKAANPLTSESIGINFSASFSFVSVGVIGIQGANTTTITDSNVSLPAAAQDAAAVMSTSHGTDFIHACYLALTTTPTVGSGWTQAVRDSVATILWEYKRVTTTQSNLSATIGSGDIEVGIGDAVVSP